MSRQPVANRTSFAFLDVQGGEESEEDVVSETPVSDVPETSVKMTKTAARKAAAARRLEKKQAKAANKAPGGSDDTPASSDISRPETPLLEPSATASKIDAGARAPTLPVPSSLNERGADLETSTASFAPVKPSPLAKTSSLPEHAKDSSKVAPKSAVAPLAAPKAKAVSLPAPVAEAVQKASETTAAALKSTKLATANIVEKATVAADQIPAAVNDIPATVKQAVVSEDPEQVKKRQNALTRTVWTFIMIGGFLALLLMGHTYMILLVMLCQTLSYREITALFSIHNSGSAPEPQSETQRARDPWSKTLNWYFFAVTNYFLYGESIIYYFKHVVFVDAHLTTLATKHRFISFMLYTIGFVGFVGSLKRGYLKQQFGMFCWVHMTLLIIVVSSHFIVNNILEGLIWLWVPASLVICNDIFAYICGVTMGRTPLIALSPKKTVEGFVGAFICTMIFSVVWGTYFMRFDYMICPVQDLGVNAFSGATCTPNPVFLWRDYQLPEVASTVLSTLGGHSITSVPYAPYQLHLLVMATFASLVAPFGGFFASGFKRAFNIKDFGDSIPGHGGMTDRMDCQFLMGVWTYVYYSSLIRDHHVTVGSLLQTIVSGLTVQDQLLLIADLRKYLDGQGISVP